jgi:hypothetical protein
VIHSATPSVQRREERLLRERLAMMDMKVDRLVKEVVTQVAAFPAEADIEEVGRLLVTGHLRLPRYATFTVTTEVEERKDPIFGTSTILHHTADELCCHALQPMSIPAAIERKLLTKVARPEGRGSTWLFRADVYRTMVPPDPRLFP